MASSDKTDDFSGDSVTTTHAPQQMAQEARAGGPVENAPTGLTADEEHWRAQAERLDLVLQATNEGLWDWDLRTDDVLFSPRWKEILGFARDELEDRLETWEQRVHPDDRASVQASIRAYLSGESPSYEVEHRLKHKDGTYRWIVARGVAVRSSAGEAIRFIGSHADISERKSTEQALKRSRRKYERLVNAVNGILWEMDARTMDLVFTSDQAERLLGYPTERWTRESGFWQSLLHPNDRDWVIREFEAALAEKRNHELEYRVIAADGRTVWFRDIVTVILENERPVSLRGVMVDVTEQKTFEEELSRRDAILEAVRYAGERLLAPTSSWAASVQDVLARLGDATGVSRVYIFENYTGPDGEVWASNTHEWVLDERLSVIDLPQLQSLSYSGIGFGRWVDILRRGETVYGHVRDFPAEERREMESEGTLSIALVPIFASGQWWGFVGFDECARERDFSAVERDALKAAADMLGAALGREQELLRRDAVLEAVRFAGELLLSATASWEESIDQVLERLGCATEVSRVYIFENYMGPAGEVWARNTHEWVVDDDLSVIELPQLQSLSYSDIGFGRWVDIFRRGEMVYGHVRDLPVSERRELEDENILSIAVVPIFVDDEWWGFIGFDECRRERKTSAMERDALNAAADTLGAAMGRRRAEDELRESQRSMQTLLSNLPGMAYRSLPGTPWRIEFVSEGAFGLTGYPPARLAGNGGFSFVDIIHPEDRAALRDHIETAITEGQPYHHTYRITTASGAEKWVSEQGRAVHDAAGEVVALEGIIMDVSDRIQSRQLLEQRVDERTRELGTLLSVSTSVASTLELEPLLGVIMDKFREVVDHVAAAVFTLEGDDDLHLLDYRGPMARSDLDWVWHLSEVGHTREVIQRGEPVIIPDVRADTPLAAAFREKAIRDLCEVPDYAASWMGVPLIVRDRPIGLLAVDSSELNAYTSRHAELALAFAAHAAVAIENARLYGEAQGKAALEERQRLARELHDSVSQALFGIGLGARTARTLIDQDPARAVAPIDYVLSLAEAGLAEMRALIFELRPEALEQEGFVIALEKQVAALQSRYGIEVELTHDGALQAPPAVEEALYRIAQEALNNVVKHARATHVDLQLERDATTITLCIADNGSGFDANGSYPGHLGLRTMCERAEKLGGSVDIQSTPGEGSTVLVSIPSSTASRK